MLHAATEICTHTPTESPGSPDGHRSRLRIRAPCASRSGGYARRRPSICLGVGGRALGRRAVPDDQPRTVDLGLALRAREESDVQRALHIRLLNRYHLKRTFLAVGNESCNEASCWPCRDIPARWPADRASCAITTRSRDPSCPRPVPPSAWSRGRGLRRMRVSSRSPLRRQENWTGCSLQ